DIVTDYRAPIITPGFPGSGHAESFDALWRRVVRLAGPADVVDLRRMPARLDAHANPMASLPEARHTENAYGMALPATIQELHARQSARRLADNRRSLRRLAEFGSVRMEPVQPEASRDAVIRTMAEQKSRRW